MLGCGTSGIGTGDGACGVLGKSRAGPGTFGTGPGVGMASGMTGGMAGCGAGTAVEKSDEVDIVVDVC